MLSRPSGAVIGMAMLIKPTLILLLLSLVLFSINIPITFNRQQLIYLIVIINLLNLIGTIQLLNTRGKQGFNFLISFM